MPDPTPNEINLLQLIEAGYHALRSYQFGNDSTQLAEEVANEMARVLTDAGRRPIDWAKEKCPSGC